MQQYLPVGSTMLPAEMRSGEWVDVPVAVPRDDESTIKVVVGPPSGPQDAVGQVVPTTALEPRPGEHSTRRLETPDDIEREIERTYALLVGLMRNRSEMSSFPPYDGTAVLVHGSGKQRLLVNGHERTMPPRSLLIVNDDDLHQLLHHTVPPLPTRPS